MRADFVRLWTITEGDMAKKTIKRPAGGWELEVEGAT